MQNKITITFNSDRELTEDEVNALMNAVAVQVEEPQVENDDPTNISSHVDADYKVFTDSVKIVHSNGSRSGDRRVSHL